MNQLFIQAKRFIGVGVINTAFDITLFALLANILGINFVVANILSTGLALLLGFMLHSRFTFGTRPGKGGLVAFIGVTLVGLWILQPIVIAYSSPLFISFGTEYALIIGKILATAVSLTWNFIWYRYVIFKTRETGSVNR